MNSNKKSFRVFARIVGMVYMHFKFCASQKITTVLKTEHIQSIENQAHTNFCSVKVESFLWLFFFHEMTYFITRKEKMADFQKKSFKIFI